MRNGFLLGDTNILIHTSGSRKYLIGDVGILQVELRHNDMNRKVGFSLGKSRKPPSHCLKERKMILAIVKRPLRRKAAQHQVTQSTNQHNHPTNQKTNKGGREGANRFLLGRTKSTSDVNTTHLAPV
jgi:hypothetical protein